MIPLRTDMTDNPRYSPLTPIAPMTSMSPVGAINRPDLNHDPMSIAAGSAQNSDVTFDRWEFPLNQLTFGE